MNSREWKSICSSSRVASALIVIPPFVGDPSTAACGPWSVVLHSLWCRTDRDCPLCGAGGAPRLGAPRTGSGTPGLGAPRAVWGAGCVDRVTCPGGAPAAGDRVDDLLYRKGDRKSTRLNSSHVAISYAVFCLKKKTYAPNMQ